MSETSLSSGSPAPGGSREHQLSLKVMRLTRPSLAPAAPVGSDPIPASPHLSALPLAAAMAPISGAPRLNYQSSASLLLPQTFESIHLGETFTAYVCVHNEGTTAVKDVSVKADLQTSSQRVSLPSKYAEAVGELEAGGSLGQVLTYEVNHQGQHILVCAVQYTQPATGKVEYFRKFFKFPVAKPLDVRTKFCNNEDNLSDEVYLEAQLENQTAAPMVLERVSLAASDLYTASQMSCGGSETPSGHLQPGDTQQFLYRLAPKTGLPPKAFKGVSSIGKLDMVWRTGMGERGRLQTSALQRVWTGTGDIRLCLHSAPSIVPLHQAFTIVAALHNASERSLELWMELEESLSPSLVWTTKANRSLGNLEPGAVLHLSLSLVPVLPGLHCVAGLRLRDQLLGRTYELDDIAQVLVT